MIPYEKLSKKSAVALSQRQAFSTLYSGLLNIEADENVPKELKGKLTPYAHAIRSIRDKSNRTRKAEDVQEVKQALKTLETLPAFLSGGEGKTIYQSIIDAGSTNSLSVQELDDGLNAVSSFLEMGLNVQSLKEAQQKLDESDPDLKDDGKPLTNAGIFERRTRRGMTFNSIPAEKNAVTDLTNILDTASYNVSQKVEKYDKKVDRKLNISEQEREDAEADRAFLASIEKYRSAIKVLNSDLDNTALSGENRQAALNDLKNFQAFLQDGEAQTNFNRIISEAFEGNQKINTHTIDKRLVTGINTLEKTLHFSLDTTKAREISPENLKRVEERKAKQAELEKKKATRRSADKWIENWKAQFNSDPAGMRAKKGYPKQFYACIMGTRDLADAKRNRLSLLMRSTISQYDIESKTKEMLEKEGHMKDFLEKLSTDKKLLAKAESSVTSSHSHGGVIDELFTDYLKNLPAGKLNNDPSLRRYVPTVKERIEALQTQAGELIREKKAPVAQVAEILVLRNMVKAERKVKGSLDVPIPLEGKSLSAEVEKMMNRESFRSLVSDPKVLSLVTKGHGGEMLTEMRNAYYNKPVMKDSFETKDALEEGTFQGRLKMIKEEAAALKQKLEKIAADAKKGPLDPEEYEKINKDSRELIAEQLSLSRHYIHGSAKGGDNIPWRKIRKVRDEIMNDENMNQTLYPQGKLKPDSIITRLDEISQSQSSLDFYVKVTDEIKKAGVARKAKEAKSADKGRDAQQKEEKPEFEIKETRTRAPKGKGMNA